MRDASPDRIRVVLVGLTGIVADIVRGALASADNVELIAGLSPAADVAIVGSNGAAHADSPDTLLRSHPLLKVLAVSGDGRRASLYEMRPHRIELGEISPQTLVNAVRTAATA